ncbi:hypothetical protein CY34DRAFT_14408 [Suillus luteus UH-Slu-Lm8-n1]|uniref:WW domain-containing protein n=1 Tax=Suillus luteus UH-Slu-Lm8-n1 TaxID=930992 RepID=A0A0D0AMV6_9AGAM|nr:hypothetical protein CY34DRAFT_14408 [Suillus luteus UH-Slu-Lm8-n1]
MPSSNRPLPGVRLDYLQLVQLVPGCEWHISPLGRSYFVDHNHRTTSWKKPTLGRPTGSLIPDCIIEGHSHSIWGLACMGTSCNVLSAAEVEGPEKFPMRSAAVDFSLVVVVLTRSTRDTIC